MLLAILIMIPSDVVLAGLGDGTNAVVTDTDKVLTFTAGQQNWAIQSVRLYGNFPSGGNASLTFRLRDSQGASLAYGGSYLAVGLDLNGTDFDLSNTAIGSYGLSAGTQYQLSMYVGSSLIMSQANGNAFEQNGWTQNTSPGVMYAIDAVAVPEPGTLLLGAFLAAVVAGGWWLWRF
jgi:hypothetical protein